MADRLIMANNSQARRQSPSAANAITVQIAACVYCPLFTDAWNVTFDVSGIDRGFIERRIEKLNQPAIRVGPDCDPRHPLPDANGLSGSTGD